MFFLGNLCLKRLFFYEKEVTMTHLKNVSGYLPDENPPLGKLLLFALQQIVVMFPATVIVALLTGFHISTTLFASGLATLCFIVVTKGKIPSTMVLALLIYRRLSQ